MLSIIYLGNDGRMKSALGFLPGYSVRMARNYRELAPERGGDDAATNHLIFIERHSRQEDLTAISFVKMHVPRTYIILISPPLGSSERVVYLGAGVNDTIADAASISDIHQKVAFVDDHADQLFADVVVQRRLFQFRIPAWKRLFDIVFSLTALIVLAPVFLATAIAIRLESPGRVWYKSKRVGANYKVFDFLKFRSMRPDADAHLKDLAALNQYGGQTEAPASVSSEAALETLIANPGTPILIGDDGMVLADDFERQREAERSAAFVKIENDPRITRVGRFIRKYSIDELPQLINILRGDMSVVGNRPLPLYEAEKLTDDDSIDRFIAPAGLTGLWQVMKRGDSGRLSADERKQLDITYAKTYSFALDCKILLKTVTAFIQKENV
ncbi:MAG: sugar transferase [Bacteroidaceae bacterium]|nr:sugar transferase [Bacteroidaceae bacterium]